MLWTVPWVKCENKDIHFVSFILINFVFYIPTMLWTECLRSSVNHRLVMVVSRLLSRDLQQFPVAVHESSFPFVLCCGHCVLRQAWYWSSSCDGRFASPPQRSPAVSGRCSRIPPTWCERRPTSSSSTSSSPSSSTCLASSRLTSSFQRRSPTCTPVGRQHVGR